jgi:glucans biosynthesis protein
LNTDSADETHDMSKDTPETLSRRRLLVGAGALGAWNALPHAAWAALPTQLEYGPAQAFSFDDLIARARTLAGQAYAPSPALSRDVLERIDYDAHGKLRYKSEFALFARGPGSFPVTFFHLGRYFQTPVHMHLLEASGRQAREILYNPAYFDMPADSPARELAAGAGFAGFRFQESRLGGAEAQKQLPWQKNDWVAFLGASYFRAIGDLYQYGLSARGVALDVAQAGKPEEFPAFTHFWFLPPSGKSGDHTVTVYALLDGPSISGAYRFDLRRDLGKNGAVLMEIDCALFLRRDVARLGIAPLTSMYWFSETDKSSAVDWRPEVHDSDGLALWTGSGERIWRPLNNPKRTMASAFADRTPRGFGLLQRDRDFDHYLDGVAYDRRPSLWVEPLGDWGAGSVQLIEIPTDDEIHDNIVAMWVPQAEAKAGSSHRLKYRLHWRADEPAAPRAALAHCVATRLGHGGEPGKPRPRGVRKFVVEFLGGPLSQLPWGVKPEAVLSASRGTFGNVFCEAVPNGVPGHWRAAFDLTVNGQEPVDMRLYLRQAGQTLSETWLYQYHPV